MIALKDGIYLSNQTNAFLFEIEGNKIFTVVSNNGIHSLELQGQGKNFEGILSESLRNVKHSNGRDDEIYDEEI